MVIPPAAAPAREGEGREREMRRDKEEEEVMMGEEEDSRSLPATSHQRQQEGGERERREEEDEEEEVLIDEEDSRARPQAPPQAPPAPSPPSPAPATEGEGSCGEGRREEREVLIEEEDCHQRQQPIAGLPAEGDTEDEGGSDASSPLLPQARLAPAPPTDTDGPPTITPESLDLLSSFRAAGQHLLQSNTAFAVVEGQSAGRRLVLKCALPQGMGEPPAAELSGAHVVQLGNKLRHEVAVISRLAARRGSIVPRLAAYGHVPAGHVFPWPQGRGEAAPGVYPVQFVRQQRPFRDTVVGVRGFFYLSDYISFLPPPVAEQLRQQLDSRASPAIDAAREEFDREMQSEEFTGVRLEDAVSPATLAAFYAERGPALAAQAEEARRNAEQQAAIDAALQDPVWSDAVSLADLISTRADLLPDMDLLNKTDRLTTTLEQLAVSSPHYRALALSALASLADIFASGVIHGDASGTNILVEWRPSSDGVMGGHLADRWVDLEMSQAIAAAESPLEPPPTHAKDVDLSPINPPHTDPASNLKSLTSLRRTVGHLCSGAAPPEHGPFSRAADTYGLCSLLVHLLLSPHMDKVLNHRGKFFAPDSPAHQQFFTVFYFKGKSITPAFEQYFAAPMEEETAALRKAVETAASPTATPTELASLAETASQLVTLQRAEDRHRWLVQIVEKAAAEIIQGSWDEDRSRDEAIRVEERQEAVRDLEMASRLIKGGMAPDERDRLTVEELVEQERMAREDHELGRA
ncbi:unnamed protein product [Vitrella brassicaformis CCMP3155]|uniref:Protein kinase domain-containing protein n=1 Tax=Vitrella brassicaformis (strain CCMP3155) TaxID=1169540 RepID=A0A0G4FRA6_VITBC|nr:unnamed protein product [Vitrella brassicaformis CCMP3155]|eukprot:CEM16576.1 unnamed protein product [Vitrella brassicaformis CCMP3155]